MVRPVIPARNFPLLPTVSFAPHLIDGPLGPFNTGNDVFSIAPLRQLAAERNSMLFYLDDRTLCLAGSGGVFSGPRWLTVRLPMLRGAEPGSQGEPGW
jgi:hypothetical protein